MSWNLTIMKTNGRAIRILAIANVDTLAETRKARPTPAKLTRDMVRAKQRKATKSGFNPENRREQVNRQVLLQTNLNFRNDSKT